MHDENTDDVLDGGSGEHFHTTWNLAIRATTMIIN